MRKEPIDKLLSPVSRLFENGSATGFILLAMVLIAMVWANSPWADSYHHLWETRFIVGFDGWALDKTLHHWINDGLMTIFFFAVGLEVKREVISGELSTWKKAALPVAAAVGGMLVPALVYLTFNYNNPTGIAGWGIPMATDIAFTLGLIALLGDRVPTSLKIFLVALATADDIGAVLVIALFYTPEVSVYDLLIGAGALGLMYGANFLGVRNIWVYFVIGVLGLWIAILLSGVHATIAGVLAAMAIPGRVTLDEDRFLKKLKTWQVDFANTPRIDGPFVSERQLDVVSDIVDGSLKSITPLQRLEHLLSPLVSYLVIPIFALANSGVRLEGDALSQLLQPVSLGIIAGLVIGKVAGILLLSRWVVRFKLGSLPKHSGWSHLAGAGMMAGIGFTMSLFIAELAFTDPAMLQQAKMGILLGSALSATLGMVWFILLKKPIPPVAHPRPETERRADATAERQPIDDLVVLREDKLVKSYHDKT